MSAATVIELLSWAKEELAFLGEREAGSSSEFLLAEILDCSRSELLLNREKTLGQDVCSRYRSFVEKRKEFIPVAYLTGKAHFWNEVLEVSSSCLIPRPETELLVEAFIEKTGFKKNDFFSFLDLGCGSGAIGIALMREFTSAKATFVDVSEKALEITRKNLRTYELLDRACLIQSDLFEKVTKTKWDAIVSNPPYFCEHDWLGIQPEVLKEPRIALAGGEDGLDYYRAILDEAHAFIKEDGWLFFEMGVNQCAAIKDLVRRSHFNFFDLVKDYQNIGRVLIARKSHG